jgi:hypothetical protein
LFGHVPGAAIASDAPRPLVNINIIVFAAS